jgi:hypothetical protein
MQVVAAEEAVLGQGNVSCEHGAPIGTVVKLLAALLGFLAS